MISSMGLVWKNGLMDLNTKAITKMEKSMAKEYYTLAMEVNILGILKITK